MGMWKIDTLIARDSKTGKWEVIGDPTPGGSQALRTKLIEMTNAGGKAKIGGKDRQFDAAAIQHGYAKRRRFKIDAAPKKSAPKK